MHLARIVPDPLMQAAVFPSASTTPDGLAVDQSLRYRKRDLSLTIWCEAPESIRNFVVLGCSTL